jgi:RHS repeat-associated protein
MQSPIHRATWRGWAFGGRREADWSSDASASTMTSIKGQQNERVSRGYTDHEHMNRTGFVHMNGRVYDPRIGRFLSPDPYVPHPMLSQSFNRYAYVLNRPLSLVDPSGFASLDPPICEPSCPAVYEPPDPNDDLFRFSPLDRWIVIQLHLQQFLWAQQQGQEQEQIAPEGTNAHQGGTGLTAFQIVYDFAYGVGPATRTFATGSTEVEAIRGIDQVNRARELFLRKVKDAGNPRDFSGITIVNCCTGLDFVDSLRDSGTSPLRQVVGNASNIMIFGGPNRTAFFTVLNRTSITSVSFDLLPSYDRDPSRSYPQPLSTIEQLFIFTETF